jgi:hypothetical protein
MIDDPSIVRVELCQLTSVIETLTDDRPSCSPAARSYSGYSTPQYRLVTVSLADDHSARDQVTGKTLSQSSIISPEVGVAQFTLSLRRAGEVSVIGVALARTGEGGSTCRSALRKTWYTSCPGRPVAVPLALRAGQALDRARVVQGRLIVVIRYGDGSCAGIGDVSAFSRCGS